MAYKVVLKISISKNALKIGEFKYEPEIDALSYTGPYLFPVQFRVSNGLKDIEVTPAFLKLPSILRGGLNLDILRREIVVMKLALQGSLLLHASCVNNTLIVGFPNSGKTYRTYKAVSEGAKLISEEYTLIKNGIASPYRNTARSCLSLRTIKACKMPMTIKEWGDLFLRTIRAKLLPFLFEAVIWKEIPLSGESAKVKRIVYGSTNCTIKDYRTLIILTDNEFPFSCNAFLQAYAMCSGLDLLDIQTKQRQLIKEFVDAVYTSAKS